MVRDYLGNLYTAVCDYLWNGSQALPQVTGLSQIVKPNNYIRWDNALAESRFTKKDQVQPADLPEVEVTMGSIATSNIDSCKMQHEVQFQVRVSTGQWKLTHATLIYQQILSLLATAFRAHECCFWDVTKDKDGYSEEPKSTIVQILIPGSGQIGRDKEVNRNMDGWTFVVAFNVQMQTNILIQSS